MRTRTAATSVPGTLAIPAGPLRATACTQFLLAGLLLAAAALSGCREPAGPERGNPDSEPNRTAVDPTPQSNGGPGTADAPQGQSTGSPPAVRPVFVDRAAELGIDFSFYTDTVPGRYFLPENMCGGLAWFDFDLDGTQDLYITNGSILKDPDPADHTHVHHLFRNSPAGGFEDITRQAGLGHNGYGQGLAVGDFNGDGFPDLCVTCYGPNRLYVNNGDGTFSDVTPVLGERQPLWSTGAVWGDVDADGDLDLFVANYMHVNWETHKTCTFGGKPGYCGPGDYESQPDWLFVNEGDGRFREAAQELGFVGDRGNGLAVAWADFDDDRRPELYVANDMAPNFLFTRSGVAGAEQPPYVDVAPRAGCAVSGHGQNEASMGIALADYDADGLLDMYLTHYYHHKNTLYHNLGGMLFEDDSYRTRVAALSHERLGFGVVAFDYDRDGAPDLFVANGHVLGPEHEPFRMLPTLIRNDTRGRFEDVSPFSGPYFERPVLGRGVAAADFDNDGSLDLAITHLDQPVALLHNQTRSDRPWIGFLLQTPDRIRPVGARIRVSAGGKTQLHHVWDGGSYYSAHDERILVGLPGEGPLEVEMDWPDGRVERFADLSPGAYWVLRPGQSPRRVGMETP